MHITSERVHREMSSEAASLWVVPANEGKEIAVLIKVTTPSIKALIEGCDAEIILGIKNQCFCSAIRIFDIPDSPLLIAGAVLHKEEHQSISRLLKERSAPIFLFNEMDICLASSNISISKADASESISLLGSEPTLYTGKFDQSCSFALDCFCYTTNKNQTLPGAVEIPITLISANIESWRINTNTFIGFQDSHSVLIDEKNEGEIFERAIWASLESVFPLALYKSPQVKIGEKERELTDVLAFHEYGSFLIEAKDLSVLQSGLDRSLERRIKGVQKQVKKAIGQLVGSHNALKRGDIISDVNGTELDVDRKIPPHCIILITELIHSGDWTKIENELFHAISSTGAFFHLLDFRELISLLKTSSGKPELLDYNLMKRFKSFSECKSVHMRCEIAPYKSIQPTTNVATD